MDREHTHKVERIAAQLRSRTATTPVSLAKRSVSHQVPKAGDRRHFDEKIDISDLDQILSIDRDKMICVAEPGVTFVDLVDATLAHGLIPIVVPELKTITIGGAVSGCSIESMSFRYGGFHDTCLEYEVITALGEVIACTPDNEHQLVFQMMHGSFGTLGIVTKLVFRLIPAKPFVHVTYAKYTSIEDYQAAIAGHAAKLDVDFMDGIIHSPRLYVLCLGRFVDKAPYQHRYDWMRVYWKTTAKRDEDYLRTEHYVFRYDRGVTNVQPSSFVGRLLFGKLLSSTQWLRLGNRLHRYLPASRPTVTVDLFLPMSKVPEFLDWHQRTLGFFPLWCVPYRRVRDYEWLAPSFYAGMKDSLFLDLAIYGMKQRSDNDHRLIEKKLEELGGVKTLISHNYYERDEFWSIFNKANYGAVKSVTDPNNIFRDLYTKTCRAAMGHPDE